MKRRWSLIRENPKAVASLIGGSVLSNIPRGMFMGLIYMIIIQLSVPVLSGETPDFSALNRYMLWYTAIFVLYFILTLWSQTNSFVQSYKISTSIRLKLGDKLRRLSLGFFKSHDPGDVTARILHDVSKAERVLSHNMPDVVSAAVVPFVLGTFLVLINLKMSLVLFGGVLLALVFTIAARKIVERLGRKHIASITETSSRILEYAGTVKLLKAYNMTGSRFQTLDRAMLKLKKLSFQQEVFAGIPVLIALFILDISYLGVLLLGATYCGKGSLTVPDFFSYAILSYYFLAPVKQLWEMLVVLRYASLSTERIREVFSTPELPSGGEKGSGNGGSIRFDKVSFSYGSNRVIQDVNCLMPEGKLTALVGYSGSGKTTMVNLIARFWDVDSGSISIGDVPITSRSQEDVLENISMVFQDVYLFNDTIAANIRIGKKDATMEEVRAAARMARCDEFIELLPKGYDTVVAEGGSSLSGGEKQRISIARAILKDAPIVLLDEATASLDPENEAEIQEAFENLVAGKTLVVIAHRFHTILHAHQILVLDGGRIAERGTHDELVKLNGVYAGLWREQQKAKSWKIGA